MKLDVKIDHEDVGFRYAEVKSLLRKFRQIEENREQLEHLRVILNIGPSEFHELSGALIWQLASHYQDLPCPKELVYSSRIESLLNNRKFFDRLSGKQAKQSISIIDRILGKQSLMAENVPVDFESFAPIRTVGNKHEDKTAEKIYTNAMKTTLQENNEFHDEVSINTLEVLNNVFDHSASSKEAGIVCVQKSGLLSVCAVDMGQGIKASFTSNPHFRSKYIGYPDENLIHEATKFKVSCNPDYARHPRYRLTSNGGIGLYYLKSLVKTHRSGQLILISGKGYYYVDSSGREIKKNLQQEKWPGTLVYFRVDLNQELNPGYRAMTQHNI